MSKNVLFKNLEIKNTNNSVLLSKKDSNNDNDNASKTSSSDNKSKKKIRIALPVKKSANKEEMINNSISDAINSRFLGFRENESINNIIKANNVEEINIKRENNNVKYNCNKDQNEDNEDFDKEKADADIDLNIDLSSYPNIIINCNINNKEANDSTDDKLDNKRVKNSIKNRALSTFNLNLIEVKKKIKDDTCNKAYPKSSRIEYKFLEDCSLKEARSSIFCKYEMSDFGKYYFNDILKLSSTNSNFDYNAVNRDNNCFSTGTQSYGLQSRLNLENAFIPKHDKLKYLNNETNFPSLFPSTHLLASQYSSDNKYNNEFIRKHQSSYNIFNIKNNNIRNQGYYDICSITNKEYDYNNEENIINDDYNIKGDSKTTNLINKNTLKISNDVDNSNKNSNINENKLYSDIDNSFYKISLNNKIILNNTNKPCNVDELNRESSTDLNKKKKTNKKIHFKEPDTEAKANYDTSDICNINDNNNYNNLNSHNRLLKKKSSQSMNDSYSSFSSTYSKNTQSCFTNNDNNQIIKDTNGSDSEVVNAKYIFKSKLYSNSNNSSSNNNNKYVNKNNLSVCYNSLFTNNKSFNSSSSNFNNNAAEVNNSFNSSPNNSLNNKISINTNINTNNTDLINLSLQKSIYNSIKNIQDTEANNDCESGKQITTSKVDNNKSSSSNIVNATDNVNTKTNNNLNSINNISNPDDLDIDKLNQDFLSILTNLNNYYSINNESNKVLSPSKFKLDRNLKSYNSSLLMPGVSTENSSFKKDFYYKNNNINNYYYNNNNKKKYSKFNTSQNITSFINLSTANVNVYNFELNRTINNDTKSINNINNSSTNNNIDNIDNNRNNKYCDYSHANQTININNKSSLNDSSHINIV